MPVDDDNRWDPARFDDDDDEMLLWDTGEDKVGALHILIFRDADLY